MSSVAWWVNDDGFAMNDAGSSPALLIGHFSQCLYIEKRLAKTRHIKQGMMQELLTGRTRFVWNMNLV